MSEFDALHSSLIEKIFGLLSQLLERLSLENAKEADSEEFAGFPRVEPEHPPLQKEAIFTGGLFDSPYILLDYNKIYLS